MARVRADRATVGGITERIALDRRGVPRGGAAARRGARTQRGGVKPVPSVASASAIFGEAGSGDVDGAHV
jgi:hypothetical protein